ncbi:FAD/NAD-binding domain-containing protein [Phellopilus nigrolimitatus]|nr:FAD/NAD-binding domain-containing protein [Phellopilus nigrolimitatus]
MSTRLHQTRLFSTSAARSSKQRLVILGSGWGGYEVLSNVDKKRWDVSMISATTYFNFTPLLAGCAVGTLEFRCAIEPVRRYAPQATAYQAWCDKIGMRFPQAASHFDQKTLTCVPATPLPSRFERSQTVSAPVPKQEAVPTDEEAATPPHKEFTLQYDKLVISVGCYAQTFNIPGVKDHAYFLKNVRDARAIRSRIIECFEEASQPMISDPERRTLLHFCIIGAGPTGVELSAELHDLLSTDIRRHYGARLADMARISLYDVAPRMLGGFEKGLADYAERKFARDGIDIKLGHHVERVEDGALHVKEQGKVPFGMLVWSTGLAPNPLVESIETMAKDGKTGSLFTDKHLHVLRTDGTADTDVWAVGDAAIIKDELLPATAQVAQQKAKYVTHVLNRLARDQTTSESFRFKNQGSLAYLGDWKALYDRTSVDSGPKVEEAGRLAWLFWRSAYFTRTLSIRNKLTVPYYWFLNWIFGRDLTRF